MHTAKDHLLISVDHNILLAAEASRTPLVDQSDKLLRQKQHTMILEARALILKAFIFHPSTFFFFIFQQPSVELGAGKNEECCSTES